MKVKRINFIYTLFVFLFIISSGSTLIAQDETDGIPFVAYWAIGDSFDFKITKIDKKWSGTDLVKNDSSSYIANFEVIDSTEHSYTINWTFKNELFDTDDESFISIFKSRAAINDIINKYTETSIVYKVDEYGETPEIINLSEIKKQTKELFDALLNEITESNSNQSKEFKKAMSAMLKIYTSDEAIKQLVLIELQYIHFPFGTEYFLDEPYEYEGEIASLISNKPIRGDVILSVENVDSDNSYCILKEETILNSGDVKEQVSLLLKKMNLDGAELSELLKSAIYDIKDINYYHYYYDPGIPDKILINRIINLSIGEQKVVISNSVKIDLLEVY